MGLLPCARWATLRASMACKPAIFAATLLVVSPVFAGAPEAPVPTERPRRHIWEVSVETAQTVGADNATDNYFATQFVSFAAEPFSPLRLGPVAVRAQLINSFVVSAILSGPDTCYLGWAPQLRAIVPLGASRWSLYGTAGFGLGAADANESDPDDGGLGQDFTFLLTANGGIRYALSDSWSVWLGASWLHFSNAGLSEPDKQNIGVDSFGPSAGIGWSF